MFCGFVKYVIITYINVEAKYTIFIHSTVSHADFRFSQLLLDHNYSLNCLLILFSSSRLRQYQRAHGGCGWSAEDAYPSMVPDPTSLLHGTLSYLLLFQSSVLALLPFCIFPSDLILNTVRYHFKRPKEKYKTRTYLKIRGRISCHEELNILRGPVTPTGKIGRQFGNYNVLTISIKESVSIEPC